MTTTCMLTKISSVSCTKVKELVSPSPQLPLSIGFLLKPPFELRRAAGGLWSVPIKSAAGRLFELRSKRYSPWTAFPPLCVLLNLLKPLNDSDAEVHEIHHVSMSPCLLTSSCGGFMMLAFGGPRMGFMALFFCLW